MRATLTDPAGVATATLGGTDGRDLTITPDQAAGTETLEIMQAGNGNYENVTLNITVIVAAKLPQTISFDPA